MELDDFKTAWKQDNVNTLPSYPSAQIEDMLRKKTHHILDKIRKSIYFEIVSMVLIVAIFFVIAWTSPFQTIRIYFGSFTFLFIPYTWVFVYLLRQTNALQKQQSSIRQQLSDYLLLMEKFQKRYLQFCMALIPVCIVFSFLLSYNTGEKIPVMDKALDAWKPGMPTLVVILVVYLGGFTAGMYYFTKWYLKKLYGRYTSLLQQNLQDLTQAD